MELALVKLSFSHPGQPKGECRRLTPEEIAALPANMRKPMDCPRERVSLYVELLVDGKLLFSGDLPPSGLAGDGTSTVYQKFPLMPGNHHLSVRLRDSNRAQGFDYEGESDVTLKAGQNFVIDFKKSLGGFVFM